MVDQETQERFEHECRIRDFYANCLSMERPDELLICTEKRHDSSLLRVDMRTVDHRQVLREWEFKLFADYRALGQIQCYIALERERTKFTREVRGVIAAFDFQPELRKAVMLLNLGIELVTIPYWMAKAGGVPMHTSANPVVVSIPTLPH